jgi:hypothetical protein
MRMLVALAGVLGGLCWLVAHAVDQQAQDALIWAGAGFLVVAVLGAGAGLVSRSTTWLRVVVAVCFLALTGSVLQVLREGGDPALVDAAAGALAILVAFVALGRRRPRRGSHAR